jgi:hypothetical protein
MTMLTPTVSIVASHEPRIYSTLKRVCHEPSQALQRPRFDGCNDHVNKCNSRHAPRRLWHGLDGRTRRGWVMILLVAVVSGLVGWLIAKNRK